MAEFEVRCVKKTGTTHEHITHLGGGNWMRTVEQVVQAIDNKTDSFHTLDNGKRVSIAVVDGAHRKFVRTHADGKWSDNLLALPACAG
jgi:hypothetical protein